MDETSKRQQILEFLLGMFKDVERATGTDPFEFKFANVGIGPLLDEDATKRAAIGIVPGTERKDDRIYPIMECQLPVNVEFRVTVMRNEVPGLIAERMLTTVQRVIALDRTCGGLAIDVKETGNSLDVLSYQDKTIIGVVNLLVLYRHSLDETRSLL